MPRTSFNNAGLPRLLASLGVHPGALRAHEAAEPPHTLAESLGQWMDWTDAIALSGVLQEPLAATAAARPASQAAAAAVSVTAPAATARAAAAAEPGKPAKAARATPAQLLAADATRLRTDLARSITLPPADDTAADPADFAPWRRHHQALQRSQAMAISHFRERVRAVLARGGPALQRLAALDAVLEPALAPRERQLLGALPGLLAPRLAQLCQAGTPERFADDWLAVLHAELQTRWQPVAGLLDALTPPP